MADREARTTDDEFWMRKALAEAAKGMHRTYPNPWVGAVVVKNGRLAAAGHHEKAGGPHAEAAALRRAGAKARGAALYVTLEPCNHFGKTPPCTQAIRAAGVRRVVAACPDPGAREGGGMAQLRRWGVEAERRWVLRGEAEALIAPFLFSVRRGRPWVVLKAGATLDGKLATAAGESKWITGEDARRDARELRGRCDGLLLGAGTVRADNPGMLPAGGSPFAPARFVLDPKASLDLSQAVFRQRGAPPVWWLVGAAASNAKLARAQSLGVAVQRFKARDLDAMLPAALEFMGGLKIRRLMVEGGGRVLGAFLRRGFAEELRLYLAPKILGGQDSLSAFAGPGPASLAGARALKDLRVEPLGVDWKVSALFAS